MAPRPQRAGVARASHSPGSAPRRPGKRLPNAQSSGPLLVSLAERRVVALTLPARLYPRAPPCVEAVVCALYVAVWGVERQCWGGRELTK